MEVSALNGMHLARIEHKTAPLSLLLSGNHQEQISFHLIDSPQTPLVLGHPWLRLHNPSLEWTSGKVSAWSTHCLLNCLRSASAPAAVAPQPVPEPPDLRLVPQDYHDLGPVFSKQHALSLPPHRPYDCAIDLLPGSSLPSSRLFNLSRPEREAMEVYIRDSLAAGLIRPSSSPVGAGFFFCSKEGQDPSPLH